MTPHDLRLSRRSLLAATAALLAGCTSRPRTVAADPDAAALATARDVELRLLAAYDAASPAYAAHLSHLRALGGTPPSAPAVASGTAAARADERASVPALQAAAQAAQRGSAAALLASIAASHAVLGQARR